LILLSEMHLTIKPPKKNIKIFVIDSHFPHIIDSGLVGADSLGNQLFAHGDYALVDA
jgi:hypothetical protein